MQNFIFSHLAALKLAAIIIAAAMAGEIGSAIDTATKSPALISALVGAAIALLIKLVDVWYENRKNQREAKQKTIATADKVLEIETSEKRELREAMNRLRMEEKQLAAERLLLSQAETFEARARAHRFGNEVMKLQSLIIGLQNTMHGAGLDIPPITFTPYHDLMFGDHAQQEELRKTQQEMRERIMHDEQQHITK